MHGEPKEAVLQIRLIALTQGPAKKHHLGYLYSAPARDVSCRYAAERLHECESDSEDSGRRIHIP
jgi:hypothetical protein